MLRLLLHLMKFNLQPCSTWLEAGAARDAGGASTIGTCVAGEVVAVDVEVSNPLQVWVMRLSWCCSKVRQERPVGKALTHLQFHTWQPCTCRSN